jgi:hypothetical protein
MPFDMLDLSQRAKKIQEITNEENKNRKEDSLRRFEIYKNNQRKYVLERLKQEFSVETVNQMRTLTSINMTKRIINKQASIYETPPERIFNEASEKEVMQLEALYEMARANQNFKKGNRYYKLNNQGTLWVMPRDGKISIRMLQPHHYDVCPDPRDPENASIYIVNILDKTDALDEVDANRDLTVNTLGSQDQRTHDTVNQKIGDREDYKSKVGRYVWWSKDFQFVTNKEGAIVDPISGEIRREIDPISLVNPIGRLPFVDLANDKDFEYWTRDGQNVVDFVIDFLMMLSDTSNIIRMQGFAQGVISSEDVPKDIRVGPHELLYLALDPNATVQPSFSFESPNPDLTGTLEFLNVALSLFLTAEGLDPKIVSGKGEAQTFSSGVERLLAMIDMFSASRDDMDLLKDAEQGVFELMVEWSNAFQGTDGLVPELKQATISDKVWLDVLYSKPEMIQTKAEREDSMIKRINAGLKSKKDALMELDGLSEEDAEAKLKEIDEESLPEAIFGAEEFKAEEE